MVNVKDVGAVGDGVADDRAAIQAALDMGGKVWFPIGNYNLGKGAGAWCLVASVPVEIVGESRDGVVLFQDDGLPANTRLLHVAAAGVIVRDMTIDGNKDGQTPNEHRHGIFASAAPNLRVLGVTARNFTGDGFYVHIGSNDALFEDCTACWNDRNGLTLGGATTGGTVRRLKSFGNVAQQLDSEPGPGTTVDDVFIEDCELTSGGDYALTVSGSGSAWQSKGWVVRRNKILGAVNVVWAKDCDIDDNEIDVMGDKHCVRVYRLCDDIRITDNRMHAINPSSAIAVWGTAGQAPTRISILDNKVWAHSPMHGIHIIATHDARVQRNELRGPAMVSLYHSGVYARATVVGQDLERLIVQDNYIADWGARGVTATASPGGVGLVDISGNTFDNSTGGMTAALAFDTARDVRQHSNLIGGTCTILVGSVPIGTWTPWGNGDRWTMP